MKRKRKESEGPSAISALGWRFHHVGIPTSVPHPDECYVEHLGIFKRGFETSPFGIEWMRFTPACQAHELVRRVPHVAFEVDDLEAAIRGRELLGEITSPSDGVRVAMIVHDGAPIELLEFSRSQKGRRQPPAAGGRH